MATTTGLIAYVQFQAALRALFFPGSDPSFLTLRVLFGFHNFLFRPELYATRFFSLPYRALRMNAIHGVGSLSAYRTDLGSRLINHRSGLLDAHDFGFIRLSNAEKAVPSQIRPKDSAFPRQALARDRFRVARRLFQDEGLRPACRNGDRDNLVRHESIRNPWSGQAHGPKKREKTSDRFKGNAHTAINALGL